MKINTYKKSNELFKRALKVVPAGIYGHLGPAEGCAIPTSAFPLFMDHAKGARFWDVDGNEFIDYMCAYGPNVLGYNDPDVDAAALEQMKKGNCVTLASPLLVDLAELMVGTVESADWAFFAKNGNDVTQFATMIAKEKTQRDKLVLVKGFYHGVSPWCQNYGYSGVTEADLCNNFYVDWNRPEQFEQLVKDHPGEIAAFISTPYYHPALGDSELPADGYWQKIRKICDDNGIVLIFDDVRCGFRLDIAGSDKHFGVKADLICFCKAIANGYNISALCGKEELKGSAENIMYTGSYWLSAVPFAAAIVCINKMKATNTAVSIKEKGIKLQTGLQKVAKSYGFSLKVTGEPAMWFMRLENDPTSVLHQEWVAECVKRGVFFTSHHNLFINDAISDDDIKQTLDVADEAYKTVKAMHPEMN